jgi:hypothetical protein
MNNINVLKRPYFIRDPMSIEERNGYRRRMQFKRRDFVKRRLDDHFPARYVILHGALLLILNIAQIVLQAVYISWNGALYYIASGIWCGILGICLAILALITGEKDNSILF